VILRVVVVVVLTTALLGVTMTGLETAQRDRSSAVVARDVDRVVTVIEDVAAREAAVDPDEQGGRRLVTLRIPPRDWAHARVRSISIGVPTDRPPAQSGDAQSTGGSAIVWQISGGVERRHTLPGIRVASGNSPGQPLRLEEPGVHRLAVSLIDWRGNRTVILHRVD